MAIQTVKTGAAVNDGTGDDARTAFTKINQNFTDSANAASRQVGIATGNVMEVGAFGLGAARLEQKTGSDFNVFTKTGFYTISNSLNGPVGKTNAWFNMIAMSHSSDSPLYVTQIACNFNDQDRIYIRTCYNSTWSGWKEIKSTLNTSIDPNGFIKNASPIVSLYADKIELNDEAKLQPITFEKLGVGDYLIKGSLGFAQEGWYIETPKEANGNVLVAVVYEQLANNDISVKTYDYMLNKKGRIVPDLETPLDIPETRWIDLRLQALPQTDIKPFSKDETVATNAE